MGNLRCVVAVAAASTAFSACGHSSSNPTTPSNVASVIVAGTPPAPGTSSQFTAIAVHTGGLNETVTSRAIWRSSNASIATVNSTGVVTGLASGPVEINATFGDVRGFLDFSVEPAPKLTLKGTIVDAVSRDPVTAATVTVRDASGTTTSGTSDTTGRYSIAGLSPGSVEVSAQASNYVTMTRSLMLSADATVDFALPRAAPCPLIGFDDLQSQGASFTTLARCGLTVAATTTNWTASTTYGRPAPFIQFVAPAGTTTVGEVLVTSAGPKFTFQSVDLYSSTTPIPYVITGIVSSATVLNIHGTQGNTFGNFATIVNPQPTTALDALLIRLTNPSAPCCSNPMGLDNIVVAF